MGKVKLVWDAPGAARRVSSGSKREAAWVRTEWLLLLLLVECSEACLERVDVVCCLTEFVLDLSPEFVVGILFLEDVEQVRRSVCDGCFESEFVAHFLFLWGQSTVSRQRNKTVSGVRTSVLIGVVGLRKRSSPSLPLRVSSPFMTVQPRKDDNDQPSVARGGGTRIRSHSNFGGQPGSRARGCPHESLQAGDGEKERAANRPLSVARLSSRSSKNGKLPISQCTSSTTLLSLATPPKNAGPLAHLPSKCGHDTTSPPPPPPTLSRLSKNSPRLYERLWEDRMQTGWARGERERRRQDLRALHRGWGGTRLGRRYTRMEGDIECGGGGQTRQADFFEAGS